jgi:hypothetical protein
MFIFGIIKAKSLTKHNNQLGYHNEATFEDEYGNQMQMKMAACCNITNGFKHLIRRFKLD